MRELGLREELAGEAEDWGGDDSISKLVTEINAAQIRSGFQFVVEVGQLVLQRMFNGDAAAFHDRRRKTNALRRVAAHPRLAMSAATLDRIVNTFEVLLRNPGIASMQHVTPSHVFKVLSLPMPIQDELLEKAERLKLSVSGLAEETRHEKTRTGHRGGRKPLPRVVREVRAYAAVLSQGDEASLDVAELQQLPFEEIGKLLDVVVSMRARANHLHGKLVELSLQVR